MKKVMIKHSVRLDEMSIQLINNHPGKNFSDKIRSLLSTYIILLNKESGEDFSEKYEVLLKGYLKDTYPSLEKEIEERRIELKKYRNTLKTLDVLEEKTIELQKRVDACCSQSTDLGCEELQEEIDKFCKWSKAFIEKTVADCVMVRKSLERSSK